MVFRPLNCIKRLVFRWPSWPDFSHFRWLFPNFWQINFVQAILFGLWCHIGLIFHSKLLPLDLNLLILRPLVKLKRKIRLLTKSSASSSALIYLQTFLSQVFFATNLIGGFLYLDNSKIPGMSIILLIVFFYASSPEAQGIQAIEFITQVSLSVATLASMWRHLYW